MNSDTLRKVGLALQGIADGFYDLSQAVLGDVTVTEAPVYFEDPKEETGGCSGCCCSSPSCGEEEVEDEGDWEDDLDEWGAVYGCDCEECCDMREEEVAECEWDDEDEEF